MCVERALENPVNVVRPSCVDCAAGASEQAPRPATPQVPARPAPHTMSGGQQVAAAEPAPRQPAPKVCCRALPPRPAPGVDGRLGRAHFDCPQCAVTWGAARGERGSWRARQGTKRERAPAGLRAGHGAAASAAHLGFGVPAAETRVADSCGTGASARDDGTLHLHPAAVAAPHRCHIRPRPEWPFDSKNMGRHIKNSAPRAWSLGEGGGAGPGGPAGSGPHVSSPFWPRTSSLQPTTVDGHVTNGALGAQQDGQHAGRHEGGAGVDARPGPSSCWVGRQIASGVHANRRRIAACTGACDLTCPTAPADLPGRRQVS